MEDLEELYQEILSLTKKQREKIVDEDYGNLLEVLDNKDKIIDKIDKINLEKYIKKQKEPQKVYKNIKQYMEKIKELEDENMEIMQKEHSEMRVKLKDINMKEKSRKGYQNFNSKYDAKFIDKKG